LTGPFAQGLISQRYRKAYHVQRRLERARS
jgi:hypothetical protein